MNTRTWSFLFLAMLTVALGSPIHSAATDSADAANRELASAFEAAWNSHDMKAFGRLLTEVVVWIDVDAGRGVGRDNDGTPRQAREGLFTWVTVKQGDAWKIRSSHNTNQNVVR